MKRWMLAILTVLLVTVTGCAYLEKAWDEVFDGDEGLGDPPALSELSKASCWRNNAAGRMMNSLSPHFPEAKFQEYLDWQLAQGCDTAHLILASRQDGEGSPWSIYGKGDSWDWSVDEAVVEHMKGGIVRYREAGFGTILWLISDDSNSWAAILGKDFERYLSDLASRGLFEHASGVVVGLELGEYYQLPRALGAALKLCFGIQPEEVPELLRAAKVSALVAATRKYYSGPVGTHENSGELRFANLGDFVCYQVNPGHDAKWIENEARRVKKAIGGKILNFFELSRNPDRFLCEAAFRGGADMVGNWSR